MPECWRTLSAIQDYFMFRPYDTPREGAPLLREGGVSKRKLPVNFRMEDAPLFAHEIERAIPPTLLLELCNVSATSEGVLFKGARILPESFSSPLILEHFLRRRRSVLKFFAATLARRRRKIAARCAWVTDDWSYGYFHWLCDALPRLFAIRGLLGELVLLLPQRYEGLEFVQSSLSLFGVRRVEYVRAGETCVCERLVMPTHAAPSGNYNEALLGEMRGLMLDRFGAHRGAARERIYLSRSRAPKRKIRNEDEVVGVLEEFGFRVEHFEDYDFARQVEIAASASHFVSNHGAGLTNTLFMRPGGSVLELRRRGDNERNWFFNLANASGLDYYYQTCAPANSDEDPHTSDLIVDPRLLRENLSLMLGSEVAGA